MNDIPNPPGYLVPLGFDLRRRTSNDRLSKEARARVDAKIAEVEAARRHALAHAYEYVIGVGRG